MVISESRWSNTAYAILFGGLALHFLIMATVIPGSGKPGAWIAMLIAYGLAVAAFRVFQVVRVRVEGTDLKVGFGLFSKRIPLHEIDRVAPVQYRWLQWGGWGIRLNRGAVMYNVPGDHGRAVELTLRNGKRVLFSAEDPDAVCAAIRAQQATMP
jgi:hypothetical protein